MSLPPATLSVDVDSVDTHLEGYGHRGLDHDPSVYVAALPRLLQVFARTGIRATFFVVGRDAETHAAHLRPLVDGGHEIASHSHTHPFAFARLPEPVMRDELERSRQALERVASRPVLGFRSPNFDVDERALGAIEAAGYRYDASGYPTLMLLPARLLLAIKSRSAEALTRLRTWPFTLRREPHVRRVNGRALVEFPVSVTPRLRFPVYHTARYVVSRRSFEAMLDALAAGGEGLSYPLHAVDALGLAEDRVDPRLARHPGMNMRLDAKLELLEESLRAILRRFEPMTFEQRLARYA